MLPLETPEAVELAKATMEAAAPKIQAVFDKNDINKEEGIKLSFEGLKYFGQPDRTRVIYMKLKEEGKDFEIVRDIVDILVRECLSANVLTEDELSHCKVNPETGRYELEQMHLTIVNASWAG